MELFNIVHSNCPVMVDINDVGPRPWPRYLILYNKCRIVKVTT